jgi:hypothetical protein
LISQSSNFVMAGVKNLVVKKHNLPITKIVDDIMEQKQGKFNDEYKYLDPKMLGWRCWTLVVNQGKQRKK